MIRIAFFGVCEVYHLHYAEPPITEYHSLNDKELANQLYIIFRMLIGKTCLRLFRVFKIPTVFAIFADNISICLVQF